MRKQEKSRAHLLGMCGCPSASCRDGVTFLAGCGQSAPLPAAEYLFLFHPVFPSFHPYFYFIQLNNIPISAKVFHSKTVLPIK